MIYPEPIQSEQPPWPEVEAHLRSQTKRRTNPETRLQRSIIAWLQAHGAVAIRVNSGVIEREYAGRRRFIRMNSASGCSDIICCVPLPQANERDGEFQDPNTGVWHTAGSTFVAIEVKTASGKTTEKQNHFLQRIKDAGGIAFVARSIADVEEHLPWLL